MRINIFLISTLILLMMPLLAIAQEPIWLMKLKQMEWMNKVIQLKLLKTHRAEAERILGKPDKFDFETSHSSESYTLEHGRVNIGYTTKECSSIDGKIKKDTIQDIGFSIERNISFSKLVYRLKIPLKQFKYYREGDNPTEHYVNDFYGIDISIQYNKLYSIDFDIPDRKKFSCVTIPSFLNDLGKVKGIHLLKTNQEDVRKIFADYEFRKDSQSDYKDWFHTTSARIEFTYSEGKCQFDSSYGYDTSKWNVESVNISPVNYIDPKDFGINLSKYKKEKIYKNIPDLYLYYDKDLGISFKVLKGEIDEINFFPPQKYIPLMCDKEKAKILSSTNSLFAEKLKDRFYNPGVVAYVEKLNLSQKEVIIGCTENKACLDTNQTISIFTRANNSDDDILTYNYTISAGKIIGKGAKVQWDLSNVKAGTYTITAAVDDGCGFCGKTVTKSVIVKECPDCKK